jgi:hypothetical protein
VVDQARKAIIDALDVVADDVVEGRLPALADDLTRIARVDHEPDPWGLALS